MRPCELMGLHGQPTTTRRRICNVSTSRWQSLTRTASGFRRLGASSELLRVGASACPALPRTRAAPRQRPAPCRQSRAPKASPCHGTYERVVSPCPRALAPRPLPSTYRPAIDVASMTHQADSSRASRVGRREQGTVLVVTSGVAAWAGTREGVPADKAAASASIEAKCAAIPTGSRRHLPSCHHSPAPSLRLSLPHSPPSTPIFVAC